MTDRLTIRIVVGCLAVIALGGLLLMGALTWGDKAIPAELNSMASGASGAIAALLARTTMSRDDGGSGSV